MDEYYLDAYIISDCSLGSIASNHGLKSSARTPLPTFEDYTLGAYNLAASNLWAYILDPVTEVLGAHLPFYGSQQYGASGCMHLEPLVNAFFSPFTFPGRLPSVGLHSGAYIMGAHSFETRLSYQSLASGLQFGGPLFGGLTVVRHTIWSRNLITSARNGQSIGT